MSTLLAAALAMVFNFRRDQRGAGAVEYALVAGLITLVIISAVGGIGSAVSRTACGMAERCMSTKCVSPALMRARRFGSDW